MAAETTNIQAVGAGKTLLSVKDLNVSYGAIHAVQGISFDIHEGEIVTLIGANGAGKSTTLNTIAGLVKPDSGNITLDEKNLVGQRARGNRRGLYPRRASEHAYPQRRYRYR